MQTIIFVYEFFGIVEIMQYKCRHSRSTSFIYATEKIPREQPLALKFSAARWLVPVFLQGDTQQQSDGICAA